MFIEKTNNFWVILIQVIAFSQNVQTYDIVFSQG
jgi:hypothetical protein